MPLHTDSSDSSDRKVRYFLSECELCHLPFVAGDDVLDFDNGTSVKFQGDCIESATGFEYCTREISRIYDEQLVRGGHCDCLRMLPRHNYKAVARVARRAFVPGMLNDREQKLRDDLASRTADTIPLPPEIRLRIAQYLVHQYSVMLMSFLSLKQPKAVTVDLSAPFTLRHSYFQGRYYLCGISNLEKSVPAQPDVVFLSEDEYGITGLYVTSFNETPRTVAEPGVWWKSMPLRNSDYTIKLYHDGFKFRRMSYGGRSTRGIPSWSTPQLPRRMQSQDWDLNNSKMPLYMSPLSYNFPGMSGISVRFNCGPAAWFSHSERDVIPSFYKADASPNSIWVFVPLQNERISVLWMRNSASPHNLAMGFETDQKRFILLGTQGTRQQLESPWSVLDIPDSKPSVFFFDNHPSGARQLLLDHRATTSPRRPPRVLHPSSSMPPATTNEAYYWSSASMENVAYIRQCQRTVGGLLKVIGLLFEYCDGSQATVGQVRLDSLTAPQLVDSSKKCLWLHFARTDRGFPYVSRCELLSMPVKRDQWFETTWTGRLEWWFSTRQCQVWQDGRTSLNTIY